MVAGWVTIRGTVVAVCRSYAGCVLAAGGGMVPVGSICKLWWQLVESWLWLARGQAEVGGEVTSPPVVGSMSG